MSTDYEKVRDLVDGLHDDAKLWVFQQQWAREAAVHLYEEDPKALWTLLSGEMLALAERVRMAEAHAYSLTADADATTDADEAPPERDESAKQRHRDELALTFAENRLRALVREAEQDMRHNDYWGGDALDMDAYRKGMREAVGGAPGELAAVFTPMAAYNLSIVMRWLRHIVAKSDEGYRDHLLKYVTGYGVDLARELFPAQDEKAAEG